MVIVEGFFIFYFSKILFSGLSRGNLPGLLSHKALIVNPLQSYTTSTNISNNSKQMFSCLDLVQFSLYFFYWSNNQLYLRWLLAVVGSPVVAGGSIVLTPTGKATKKESMRRLFLLKLTAGTNPSRHVSKIERFYSCGEQIYKFTGTKEVVYIKKSSIPTGLALETTTAAVSLLRDNNVEFPTTWRSWRHMKTLYAVWVSKTLTCSPWVSS